MEGKQKRLLEEETELNSRQEVQSDTVCLEIRNEMPASSLMYCTLSLEPMFSVRISIFLQSCKTKSGTESLDSRLGVHHHSNLVSIETGS